MTNFSFEYWGTASGAAFTSPNIEARVRFYRMDGAPFNSMPTPGSTLFDSSWFAVPAPTDRNTFVFGENDFGPSGVFLPDRELTWSVQFRNVGEGDSVGFDVYSLPTVGQAYPDYWEKIGEAWVLKQEPAGPVDIAARIEGTVPEPSTLGLLVTGGVAVVLSTRRRRLKSKR